MSDMSAELEPRLFSVDEYHLAWEAGAFGNDRVELLDGLIVEMPPIGDSHWWLHAKISQYLFTQLPGRAFIVPQGSFPLELRSEPQPDIALLPVARAAAPGRPEAHEFLAFIEVSASSLHADLGAKLRLYARAGIPDYLVVDVEKNVLLHHTMPSGIAYDSLRRLNLGDTFTLSRIPDIALEASAFLIPSAE